jgi:hypothetical protein
MTIDINGKTFESPDNGKTVYVRNLGDPINSRVLYSQSPDIEYNIRWHKWKEILALSREDPRLAELVNKAEMMYELLK